MEQKSPGETHNPSEVYSDSEVGFKALADQSPMIVYIVEPTEDARISYFNKAWLEYTGQSIDEALGRAWDGIVHPDDVQEVFDLYLPAFQNRESYTLPAIRLRRHDGEYQWYLFKGNPRYSPRGEFMGYVGIGIDIHQQKMSEQALRESAEKFQSLLEALPQIAWTNLVSGEVNFYNQRWYSYTGLSFEETANWGWQNVMHPGDLDVTMREFTEALQTGKTYEMEARFRHADGEYRWHLNRAMPIKNNLGEITLWIGTATDIHDRKLAEQALQQSEERVRSLVESAPFPIGVYEGREMRIGLANQSILDTWGKGNDVIGKLYTEVLPELNNQQIFKQLDDVFTTGVPFNARGERVDLLIAGQLKPHYFNYSFTPLFNSEGKVFGVMNTAAEVTDLHIAKQMVEQSERNFRNMILQAPVAMCIMLGPAHVVEVANDAMIQLWGKTREEVINKPIFEAVPDAAAQGLEELLEDVFKTGKSIAANERPVQLYRHDKLDTTYQNFVYDPYYDLEGNILGVLAISLDVTAQVLARQKIEDVVAERTKELAEANFQLQQSNTELNQFAYIASHDLQEPLRKVRTFTDMMSKSLGEVPEKAAGYITKIKYSAERMQNLINDVLMFSLLSKEKNQFEKVDMNEIFNQIVVDFELLIEQRGAKVIKGELPVIEAIPLQVRQLINNLLSNSLKFNSPERGMEINIGCRKLTVGEISVYPELNTARIHYQIDFKDNGIGFNQENADKIFTMFQRLHSKAEYEGTGIGLAMCRKIIHNHRGVIFATSNLGHGATFSVILPATQNA